ncbi:MAG: GatB/YqeY domain-containing protein [Thermodesulfobacteriota bacterium]
MRIQEEIKKDLMIAMKEKDEERKSILRVVMGEFGRADTKEVNDEEAIKILKKLVKSEKETMERTGDTGESRFVAVVESYLPQKATEAEIRRWIETNIDFSKYKNRMQAMRDIMAHFGSSADGAQVKEILQKLE